MTVVSNSEFVVILYPHSCLPIAFAACASVHSPVAHGKSKLAVALSNAANNS